ncbi:hypothetical protein JTB14_017472 [Gonioctena quinquepunctata]|nr:hypothetical protein JTB14_017472 [Gonioctena quinquepunctata]
MASHQAENEKQQTPIIQGKRWPQAADSNDDKNSLLSKNTITADFVKEAISSAQRNTEWHKQAPHKHRRNNSMRKPIIGITKEIQWVKTADKKGYLHVYNLQNGLHIIAPHIPLKCETLNETESECSMFV